LLSKNIKIKICGTITLPIVLYGCEAWSLTLREESRLRIFENRALRRKFGIKRDEETGEWRSLHNRQLNDLNTSPNFIRVNKSRKMGLDGHVARMGRGNVHTYMLKERDHLEDLGVCWRIILKWVFKKLDRGMDWIDLAQDRERRRTFMDAVEKFSRFTKLMEFID
jgi:hypothetical protein